MYSISKTHKQFFLWKINLNLYPVYNSRVIEKIKYVVKVN